ncbi:MAG: hypothetical protein F6K62_21935 [Sphaerospermopsis sp. SIO1G2]|nr:hypothetical protein [Sphaerospermopsis sp. SIO1G1]NET73498.1 hypothetical protein [Sphaerospermopsis sp. SIO1G2]
MTYPDDDHLLQRRQQFHSKAQIIIYISFISFGCCMLVSGFHTVFQAWERSEQTTISANETQWDKF